MKSVIDPKNYDLFLQSPFGKYLLDGINDEEKVEKKGITKVSEFIHDQNNFKKAIQRAKFDACLQQSLFQKPVVKKPVVRKPMSKGEYYRKNLEHMKDNRISLKDQ